MVDPTYTARMEDFLQRERLDPAPPGTGQRALDFATIMNASPTFRLYLDAFLAQRERFADPGDFECLLVATFEMGLRAGITLGDFEVPAVQ